MSLLTMLLNFSIDMFSNLFSGYEPHFLGNDISVVDEHDKSKHVIKIAKKYLITKIQFSLLKPLIDLQIYRVNTFDSPQFQS
mgnify:CR=1 FL=1